MRTVLVTGGAGFIGSHFIRTLLHQSHVVKVVNLDSLTYAGNLQNLDDISGHPHYTFIKGNICDTQAVQAIFEEYAPDCVVNFAAQTHVDRSIQSPSVFFETNVLGTQTLLEAARKHWGSGGERIRFLQISTDEVYGAASGKACDETAPLLPNSPYAASKASADLLVRAYRQTYGLAVGITRSSNNYGSCQNPEKLIPLMIGKCLSGQALPVYGNGLQRRNWLHVLDHCRALCLVLEQGIPGEIYNIGGSCEKTNLEIIRMILTQTGQPDSMIAYVSDRPGHDFRYHMDSSKILRALGWQPEIAFDQGMRETIAWYVKHFSCKATAN